MDTPTHVLTGIAAGELGLRQRAVSFLVDPDDSKAQRRAFAMVRWTMAFAALMPDLDIVVRYWGGLEAYVRWHRVFTHSLIMLPFWALVCGAFSYGVVAYWQRFHGRYKMGARLYWFLTACSALAIFVHILGDWITGFGTLLLWPLNEVRYALSAVFIIDPPISLLALIIILFGIFGPRSRSKSILGGVIGYAILLSYVGGLSWSQRSVSDQATSLAPLGAGEQVVRIDVEPQPLSPMVWFVAVQTKDHQGVSYVLENRVDVKGLALGEWERFSMALPNGLQRPADGENSAVDTFRWFAEVPVPDKTVMDDGRTRLRWYDHRFRAKMPWTEELSTPRFIMLEEWYNKNGDFESASIRSAGDKEDSTADED